MNFLGALETGRFDTSPMFNQFLLGLSRQRHSLPLTVLKLFCFLRRINTTLILFCLSLQSGVSVGGKGLVEIFGGNAIFDILILKNVAIN